MGESSQILGVNWADARRPVKLPAAPVHVVYDLFGGLGGREEHEFKAGRINLRDFTKYSLGILRPEGKLDHIF